MGISAVSGSLTSIIAGRILKILGVMGALISAGHAVLRVTVTAVQGVLANGLAPQVLVLRISTSSGLAEIAMAIARTASTRIPALTAGFQADVTGLQTLWQELHSALIGALL